MTILAAQNLFRDGLMAMVDGRHEQAAEHFKEAMRLEKLRGVRHQHVRCLSYYGLNLALAYRPTQEALQAVETAARIQPYGADMHLNHGRVLALAGRRTRALEAFERGLKLSPDHRTLLSERAKLDRRSRPVLTFLSRAHPLNWALGRARSAVGSKGEERSTASV